MSSRALELIAAGLRREIRTTRDMQRRTTAIVDLQRIERIRYGVAGGPR